MRVFLCILVFLCHKEPTAAESTEAESTQASLTVSETHPATTPGKPTTEKSSETCAGWCIKDNPVNVKKIESNITSKDLNDRLLLMKKEVEKEPYFPMKGGINLYADKNQHANNVMNTPTKLLDKNVILIPSTLFFPYTKRMLERILMGSGQIYIPKRRSAGINDESAMISGGFFPFLSQNMVTFNNKYFEKNPLLHSKSPDQPRRKVKLSLRSKYNGRSKKEDKGSRGGLIKNNLKELKAGTLANFLGYTNKNSRRSLRSSKIKKLLQTNQDTIVADPQNTVDNIVGAMKVNNGAKDTFIFGKDKDAVKKLNTWLGRNNKSRSVALNQGNGYVVDDKVKVKAVNYLLRSMLENYQYGSAALHYKKF